MKYTPYLAIAIAASLSACGGGSGSTASTTPTTTKTTTTIAQGMVTGFGSVVVNGVHFDVKDANIDVDGDSHVESELGVGQMVRITGTVDADGIHGKATKLEGESQLRGPIDSIDLTNGILVALGQSILINADTFYEDGLTAASLKVGDVIKVSSYTNADGKLVATRIEVKTGVAATEMLLAGIVADLDATAMTFTINGTSIDYSKATINDLPNKTLANGMRVRVHGSIVMDVFVAVGNVHASPLDLKHDKDIDLHVDVEMSGLVSALVANTSFSLGEVNVLINGDTKFEGGAATNLANEIMVRVHGKLDADHNLVATNIKLNFMPKVEDEGLITAIDLSNNTFALNGVTFAVTVDTSFNDRSTSHVRLFSLKDLLIGDFIDVRGYKIVGTTTTPDRIIATRVERHNPSEKDPHGFKVEVSGTIESVTDMMLKIAGHNIRVTANTVITGFDNLSAFLSGAVGLKVEVKGVIEHDEFIAREIKLEVDEHEVEEHDSSSSAEASSSASENVSHESSSVSHDSSSVSHDSSSVSHESSVAASHGDLSSSVASSSSSTI